ncbi:hypothetical protein CPB83DRAFT_817391 [Crepidotus variabilis]|uniref:Uncharacterized protein n=1 Tax=Crepidotus variabilis TaxID=179855 RepID=A0A9P6ECC0_9AGAR|nr:hypothetical protein CPB83DRAFT_817391 [Crepidotus variabilis]
MLANLWGVLFEPALRWVTLLAGKELELTPAVCIQKSSSLLKLALCMDKFTIPHAYYDPATYDLSQPVGSQREDWKRLVQQLLDVDTFGLCSAIPIPPSLKGIYTIEYFKGYCILHELTSPCGFYLKGWGYMIVPASDTRVSRDIHLAAPHPGYDLGTVEQVASMFERTGARSMLVAGRNRTALLEESSCIIPTSPRQYYYKTDPTHNNLEPFVDASLAVYHWQHRRAGCPSSSCAFIQIHAKGPSTCPDDTLFLSSGLGNSVASKAWYSDNTDRPVKRLKQTLKNNFSAWNISLPSDSSCALTATKNVVGRHINGVNSSRVCQQAATSRIASGEFIHAEQASDALKQEHYAAWSKAICEAFEPRCTEGTKIDRKSGLCTAMNSQVVDQDVQPALYEHIRNIYRLINAL